MQSIPGGPLQMDRKEFDERAASVRFGVPELWRKQSAINGTNEWRIALLEQYVADLIYRVDTLMRAASGGAGESKCEATEVKPNGG